jgi:chemotaxis protein MotB
MRSRNRATRSTHSGTTHDRWLVSYADFVTLLFAFFVVLFASARHDNRAIQSLSKSVHEGFDQMGARPPDVSSTAHAAHVVASMPSIAPASFTDLNNELRSALGDSIAKHQVVLQQSRDGLVISLRELGFFSSGGARLLPAAHEPLVRTAKILGAHHVQMRIEGHSDDQPIHNSMFESNWQLSTARAMSVLFVLVDECGVDPQKISLAGYGPYRPIAGNDTPEGRSMNRRVDLVILEDQGNEKVAH